MNGATQSTSKESDHHGLSARAWTRDLRRVCIHEYAHLHVARYHGVAGWVQIDRRNVEDWRKEKHFAGRFQPLHLGDSAAALIGLAGICAEELYENEAITAYEIVDWLECGWIALSQTDAQMAGIFDLHSVENCLQVLRRLWREIVDEAQLHIAMESSGT